MKEEYPEMKPEDRLEWRTDEVKQPKYPSKVRSPKVKYKKLSSVWLLRRL